MFVRDIIKIRGISMKVILGEEFITDKEAAMRYGYSQSWFIRKRIKGDGPKYKQIANHGRVLYPVVETDAWFKEKMKEKE
jgi:predicted DNA-binding transcriptional regulator AlpA